MANHRARNETKFQQGGPHPDCKNLSAFNFCETKKSPGLLMPRRFANREMSCPLFLVFFIPLELSLSPVETFLPTRILLCSFGAGALRLRKVHREQCARRKIAPLFRPIVASGRRSGDLGISLSHLLPSIDTGGSFSTSEKWLSQDRNHRINDHFATIWIYVRLMV